LNLAAGVILQRVKNLYVHPLTKPRTKLKDNAKIEYVKKEKKKEIQIQTKNLM